MAKKSSIEKNNRRAKLAKQKAPARERLKALARDRDAPPEERFAAQLKLAELPRNSSATRVRNRCALTGRPRGYLPQVQAVAHRGARAGLGRTDPRHAQVELVTGGKP